MWVAAVLLVSAMLQKMLRFFTRTSKLHLVSSSSQKVTISITWDHVFIFKGVRKAKVFLPVNTQVGCMYKHHQLACITCCKDATTPYVDFCVAMATSTALREATQPAICVLSLLLPRMIPLGFVPWEGYQLPPASTSFHFL